MQGVRGIGRDSEDEDLPDVFDAPEAEPTEVFVNPFACRVNPLDWREVQVCACVTACSREPAVPACNRHVLLADSCEPALQLLHCLYLLFTYQHMYTLRLVCHSAHALSVVKASMARWSPGQGA